MKVLLDTHIFLWFISADARLPISMREGIQDPGNQVYLSSVSVWEVIVKNQLGKLPLPAPPASYLPAQRARHRIESLPLDEGSVAQLPRLPAIHRDPFDRMLVCQALQHDLVLATEDETLRSYTVSVEGSPWCRPR
jgi:PIN domain nuclease of toxin-antitoxin system